MPANYTLIEKITVGAAGASSVTFSGIPQTGYTDLIVKVSARGTQSATYATYEIKFNGSTTGYSLRQLYGSGSAVASDQNSIRIALDAVGATATASTFSNNEIYIPNYTSANYKSVSLDGVTENNATEAYAELYAGLWSNTAAITSIALEMLTGSFVANSTFYLYGVAKLGTTPAIVPYATGGDIIDTDGTYWYHTFLSSGTFTPQKALSADYLVVAGGGGGALAGAGGGAGGLRSTVTATGGGGSLESALSLASGTGYTVTIGAGGTGGAGGAGTNGSNSVFSTITSTGGGRGGSGGGVYTPSSGGSGGGGERDGSSNPQSGAAGTANQGYAGGSGVSGAGGGGGGAGAVGTNGTTGNGGNGGNGVATSISGSSVTYAGGGGGRSTSTQGTGGTGGGGAGSNSLTTGNPGTANTGGGGGGVGSGTGGAGGSGIVIVRYAV